MQLKPQLLAILIAISSFYATSLKGQGISISLSGSKADTSAIVDVSSTNQGILIPRLTLAQRNTIYSPKAGLMVFQTNGTSGFYYYDGTSWVSLNGTGAQGPSGPAPAGTGIVRVSGGILQTPDTLKGDVVTHGSSLVTTISNGCVTTNKINNGAVTIAKISATGTPSSSTFLRGDSTWSTAAAVSNVKQPLKTMICTAGIYPNGATVTAGFFIGQIVQWGGNFTTSGFKDCNGTIIPISQNTALFSIMGTNYGGNGTSNFALPNCINNEMTGY